MARGGRPRSKVVRKGRRFSSRPPTPKAKPITKLAKARPITKAGDFISIRTRKGGVQQVRIVSKSSGKSTKFNIPAKRFDRSAKDPRAVPLKVSTTKKPSRVTVASPSGRAGRTITVSSKSSLVRGRTLGRAFGKRKKKAKGLRTRPRPDRPIPKKEKTFGSDFDIFRVSDVGGQVQLSKQTTRTGRTGKKKPTGIPQSFTDTRVSRPRKPQKAQPRLPPSSSPFVSGLFEVAGEVPLFLPRQVAKGVGEAVEFVSERVSKKPIPKEERAFGSDFDVLNFFG